MATFSDLEVVVARFGFPDEGIQAGQVGTVVHVFRAPTEAYLVEFANMNELPSVFRLPTDGFHATRFS